nr:hypothetical protein [Nocardiopsis sp. FR4]
MLKLAVDSLYLLPDVQDAMIEVNIAPSDTEYFATPQSIERE